MKYTSTTAHASSALHYGARAKFMKATGQATYRLRIVSPRNKKNGTGERKQLKKKTEYRSDNNIFTSLPLSSSSFPPPRRRRPLGLSLRPVCPSSHREISNLLGAAIKIAIYDPFQAPAKQNQFYTWSIHRFQAPDMIMCPA